VLKPGIHQVFEEWNQLAEKIMKDGMDLKLFMYVFILLSKAAFTLRVNLHKNFIKVSKITLKSFLFLT
jgi:hypothetical protein